MLEEKLDRSLHETKGALEQLYKWFQVIKDGQTEATSNIQKLWLKERENVEQLEVARGVGGEGSAARGQLRGPDPLTDQPSAAPSRSRSREDPRRDRFRTADLPRGGNDSEGMADFGPVPSEPSAEEGVSALSL